MSDQLAALESRLNQRFEALGTIIESSRAELRTDIESLRTELRTESESSRAEFRTELSRRVDELRTEFFRHVDEVAATLEESIRDSQTEVLRAVVSTQEGNAARLGSVENVNFALQQRIGVLERRLLEIEKRLHLAS